MSVPQYTPAIDIWSIGCIFAEVLTGKPLFPGKSVVHQLELITDLLGTPSVETVSTVRNEKARKYLTDMRKKQPVVFSEKFRNADPLALRLMQRLLAFDPKDRPTAEQALADPYFKGLSKIEREPSCHPISKLEFEFERRRVSKEDVRELIYREILEYHPQLLKDYMSGNDGPNYLYPSAIGHFRRQFSHLEEKTGCVPLDRKHTSLPRSTVNSSTIVSKTQQNYCMLDNKRNAEEATGVVCIGQTISGNASSMSRPPPRVPAGPVLPYENGRGVENAHNGKFYSQNPIFPPQSISPHYSFRSNTGKNQEKLGIDPKRLSSRPEGQAINRFPSNPMGGMNINNNPNYQSQAKASSVNSHHAHISIDANLLQAQTLGAVSAATLAVAARREVGSVQYGMT